MSWERGARAVRSLRTLDRRVQQAEVGVCLIALALMIGLASIQVFLRKFQGSIFQPVSWFDLVNYQLVIWVGMLGASLATAEGRHIAIEAIPKLLSIRARRWVEVGVNLAALALSLLLLRLSLAYLSSLHEDQHLFIIEALGKTKVHRWPFLVVVPLGFGLISWRFLLRALEAGFFNDEEFAALNDHDADDPPVVDAPAESPPLPRPLTSSTKNALQSERWLQSTSPNAHPDLRVVGRSTDEIPVYRELADEGDLLEPEVSYREELAITSESTDILTPHLDSETSMEISDMLEDAVESVADTRRLSETFSQDSNDESQEDLPPQTPSDLTGKLPPPDMPERDTDDSDRGPS